MLPFPTTPSHQVHERLQMCSEVVRRAGVGHVRGCVTVGGYISRSSIDALIGPTSRSSISSSSPVLSLSWGCGRKPSLIRRSRVTRCGALAVSKLAFQSKSGGRRSCRAAAKAGSPTMAGYVGLWTGL